MKQSIFLVLVIMSLIACNQQQDQTWKLEKRIDSLEKKLDKAYKPGLGEFMSGIQVHHAKLWFAGRAENWKLAEFEVNEIRESIEDIQKYVTDRQETQQLPMLMPVLERVNSAIKEQNIEKFKSSFQLLTNTCNNCHHTTDHEFNVIVIPETPPFSNQRFQNGPLK